MATISAIETHYAGYRFRSRLEARWAVFLDHMSISWEYEPEGLNVSVGEHRLKWLPDFALASGQWAEVKGMLAPDDAIRLMYLASGVSECGSGSDVVVLGHIPRPGSIRWPVQLHKHGDLWAVPWTLAPGCPLERSPQRIPLRGNIEISLLLEGIASGVPEEAEEALEAARCARFEWGESG